MSTAKGGFFDANLYNLKKEIKIWKLTEDINSFQIIISKRSLTIYIILSTRFNEPMC